MGASSLKLKYTPWGIPLVCKPLKRLWAHTHCWKQSWLLSKLMGQSIYLAHKSRYISWVGGRTGQVSGTFMQLVTLHPWSEGKNEGEHACCLLLSSVYPTYTVHNLSREWNTHRGWVFLPQLCNKENPSQACPETLLPATSPFCQADD